MLLIALAVALEAAPSSKIDLLCTTRPNGGQVRFHFSIDEASKTYTGKADDTRAQSGTAEVTEDAITLVDKDGKITFTYHISRSTGDLEMDGGLTSGPVVIRVPGSCVKFPGRAF